MGFNLGNERIQDSYPQLVQISGSTLVNGTGTTIPAITNINSVSSSYAITASYADYAVSASYEIVHEVSSSYAETASFANFATSAGTATSATTATSASHALFANQAGTATSASHALYADQAGTAGTATTATSASHALYADQAGNATSATTSTSASHALFANQAGTATTATTASYIDPTFISASAAASGFGGGGGTTPTLQQVTEVGNVTNLPITASAFSGNGSGLTNINTAFGAETFFNAADYVIDIPGDANDAAYTVSISQSGVYLISASKVPPYGANGPRVNLQWCPQQLGSGTAKVKFFIPSLDTGTGITYKQSVSCSADYQYIWNSTTSPSSSTSSTIARSLTLPQYSNGSGVTNMIKGQDGFVYFSTAGTPVPSQGYIYTGPSIGLLV